MTCETCRFWDADKVYGRISGLCRANAPLMATVDGTTGVDGVGPSTDAKDWCGRHELTRELRLAREQAIWEAAAGT